MQFTTYSLASPSLTTLVRSHHNLGTGTSSRHAHRRILVARGLHPPKPREPPAGQLDPNDDEFDLRRQLDDTGLEMLSLDCLNELVTRFGRLISESLPRAMARLLGLLEHPVEGVRKRASVTLAPVGALLGPEDFGRLVGELLRRMGAVEGSQVSPRSRRL